MPEYADLEIGLRLVEGEDFNIDMRFNLPGDEEEKRASGQTKIPLKELSGLQNDPAAYGETLFTSLFSGELGNRYSEWLGRVRENKLPLRLRLAIDPSAAILNSLHWEKLRDPGSKTAIGVDENLSLTRWVSSTSGGSVRLRPKEELKALVVVANPNNLADAGLQEVDVPGELARARQALGNLQMSSLPEEAPGGTASLQNLLDRQRQGSFDILYLVCHGAYSDSGESRLYLEDEQGRMARVPGAVFVERLMALPERPLLVVLASCESAGKGTGEALSALGPHLAEAGIPAVLAMQGKISMETVAQFMPRFFSELLEDGQLDRALAVARGIVQGQEDYWMPALFMRLKRGRIWYQPGFGVSQEFERWDELVRNIDKLRCTPIIGGGLFEPLLGPQREIARQWAIERRFPLEEYERESLPQVAQFLAIKKSRTFLSDELEDHLKKQVLARFGDRLPEKYRQGRYSYNELLTAAARIRWENHENEAYRLLARMPFPLYITTNFNELLVAALREEKRSPRVMLCPWYKDTQAVGQETVDEDYEPTVQEPLVFHMFGQLEELDSVVLTEDDYFNFLIGVTRNQKLIPPKVLRALTDKALLFLGFQVDDWNFRVLLRFILSLGGNSRAKDYRHIAAQIEPEEGRILEPDSARRYLEEYFSVSTRLQTSIFWGSTEEFLAKLAQQLPSLEEYLPQEAGQQPPKEVQEPQ